VRSFHDFSICRSVYELRVLREKRFQFKTPQATAAYKLTSTLRRNVATHMSLTAGLIRDYFYPQNKSSQTIQNVGRIP